MSLSLRDAFQDVIRCQRLSMSLSLWDAFHNVTGSEQFVCGDLPNDQEALVERNGCKVEYRGEDGLHRGGRECH